MYGSPYPPRWSDRPRTRKPVEPERATKQETPRVARLKTQAAIRRGRRLTVLVLTVLCGFELVAALFTSPLFAVRQVRLNVTGNLTAAEADALDQAVLLAPTTNWLRVSAGDMEKRLRAFPAVRAAAVTRSLPNGIEAQVYPRVPMLIVETGGKRYEVDADGVPIRLARPETARLPLVVLHRSQPIIPGVGVNDATLQAVLEMAQKPEVNLWSRIAKIEVDQSDNLCLNMHDGIRIQCGTVEELAKKFVLVGTIYARDPDIAARLVAINLTTPDWPACTRRPAETTPAPTEEQL